MSCCLILLIALLGPRVAIVVVALFTAYLEKPFDGFLIPLLGLIFLPFTTLAYAWAINTRGEVAGIQAAVVVIAVLADLCVFAGSESQRRRRI